MLPVGVIAAADPLDSGLGGWWRFRGDVLDSSGAANNGTINGTVTAAADKYGNTASAYTFDGTTGYVSLAPSLPIYSTTLPFSVCMWIKGASQSNTRIYADGNSTSTAQMFSLHSAGTKLQNLIRTSGSVNVKTVTSVGDVFDNTWRHITYTDVAGDAHLYINGVADATNFTYTPQALGTLNRSTIGALVRTTVANFFNGSISDVRFYRRVLAAREIATLYNATQRI